MKKAPIVVLMAFAILKVHAQDYLISFAGAGASTSVGTVKVDNLTSGATVTLNGGDVLHLTAITGTGNPGSDAGSLRIYPNPMVNQSTLAFDAPENGDAVICIDDISGKTVCRISNLIDCLGGVNVAIGKLRESGTTHWESPNEGATNESGFTALPGGFRAGYGTDGNFYYVNKRGYWFSSTFMVATGISMLYNYSFVATNYDFMSWGYSVRCIKE